MVDAISDDEGPKIGRALGGQQLGHVCIVDGDLKAKIGAYSSRLFFMNR